MLNMCHPSIYWGCSREKRDTNPCPRGVYILLGDIWRESFLQEESEMSVRLVTCGPVHSLQWSRQRVVANEVGGLREQLGWGFGCSYKDFSFSSLEKDMAPHSSTLTWKIPWTEDPGRLQSMGHEELVTTEWLHFHFQGTPWRLVSRTVLVFYGITLASVWK